MFTRIVKYEGLLELSWKSDCVELDQVIRKLLNSTWMYVSVRYSILMQEVYTL
jgi:hypothetical protein